MDADAAFSSGMTERAPQKLMNIDFIYAYRYLISYASIQELNEMLPVIALKQGQILKSIKATSYALSGGKLKNDKLKKKELITTTEDQQLKISIAKGLKYKSGLLELEVETQTNFFNSLYPRFNTRASFERTLIMSIPSILEYKLPSDDLMPELLSEENNDFIFLQFDRETPDWDQLTKEYWCDCKTCTYRINAEAEALSNISLELETITLPPRVDIGIPVFISR